MWPRDAAFGEMDRRSDICFDHGPLVAAITLLIQLKTHILSESPNVPMTGMLRPHGGVDPGVGSFV